LIGSENITGGEKLAGSAKQYPRTGKIAKGD